MSGLSPYQIAFARQSQQTVLPGTATVLSTRVPVIELRPTIQDVSEKTRVTSFSGSSVGNVTIPGTVVMTATPVVPAPPPPVVAVLQANTQVTVPVTTQRFQVDTKYQQNDSTRVTTLYQRPLGSSTTIVTAPNAAAAVQQAATQALYQSSPQPVMVSATATTTPALVLPSQPPTPPSVIVRTPTLVIPSQPPPTIVRTPQTLVMPSQPPPTIVRTPQTLVMPSQSQPPTLMTGRAIPSAPVVTSSTGPAMVTVVPVSARPQSSAPQAASPGSMSTVLVQSSAPLVSVPSASTVVSNPPPSSSAGVVTGVAVGSAPAPLAGTVTLPPSTIASPIVVTGVTASTPIYDIKQVPTMTGTATPAPESAATTLQSLQMIAEVPFRAHIFGSSPAAYMYAYAIKTGMPTAAQIFLWTGVPGERTSERKTDGDFAGWQRSRDESKQINLGLSENNLIRLNEETTALLQRIGLVPQVLNLKMSTDSLLQTQVWTAGLAKSVQDSGVQIISERLEYSQWKNLMQEIAQESKIKRIPTHVIFTDPLPVRARKQLGIRKARSPVITYTLSWLQENFDNGMPAMMQRQISEPEVRSLLKDRRFRSTSLNESVVMEISDVDRVGLGLPTTGVYNQRFVLNRYVLSLYTPLVSLYDNSVYLWLAHNAQFQFFALFNSDYTDFITQRSNNTFLAIVDAIVKTQGITPDELKRLQTALNTQVYARFKTIRLGVELISGCVTDPRLTNEQREELQRALNLPTDEQVCASLALERKPPTTPLTDYIRGLFPTVFARADLKAANELAMQQTKEDKLRASQAKAQSRSRSRRSRSPPAARGVRLSSGRQPTPAIEFGSQ